jgi:hypothetical protein
LKRKAEIQKEAVRSSFPFRLPPFKVINIRIHLIKEVVGQFGILFETFLIILAFGNEVNEGK